MPKIVWNGCDNYELVETVTNNKDYEYDVKKEILYHGAHQFKAFEVTEIPDEDLYYFIDAGLPYYVVAGGKGYTYYKDID